MRGNCRYKLRALTLMSLPRLSHYKTIDYGLPNITA